MTQYYCRHLSSVTAIVFWARMVYNDCDKGGITEMTARICTAYIIHLSKSWSMDQGEMTLAIRQSSFNGHNVLGVFGISLDDINYCFGDKCYEFDCHVILEGEVGEETLGRYNLLPNTDIVLCGIGRPENIHTERTKREES